MDVQMVEVDDSGEILSSELLETADPMEDPYTRADIRTRALDLSVQFVTKTNKFRTLAATDEEVLETAKKFEAFIVG